MRFKENVVLAEHSNYRIGGPARFFFEAKNIEEINWAAREAERRGLPIFILGGGTNLLIDDRGFEGLVVKPKIGFLETDGEGVRVGAGVEMKDLLNFAAESGLGGLEWAGGLPGTLGGAIRGNAGAFGGEIKDVVAEVESLDMKTGDARRRGAVECKFAYRSSIFKEGDGDEIILAATLALRRGDAAEIRRATEEKIEYRKRRHPLEHPNIGSIFKNVDLARICADGTRSYAEAVRRSVFDLRGLAAPVKVDPFPVVPAAYLISEAGLKGVSCGGAMISPKHPNFIVNVFGASSGEIESLIALVKGEVHGKFGIDLEEEVRTLTTPQAVNVL